MKRSVALTIALLTIIALPNNVGAVTYGDPVESPQVEFPEVVPIWVGGKSLCTGTLIRQQVVLTAAHCVYGESGPFQISVGAKNLNSGSLIDVDATWYHPRYDASFSQNDIALLHLKTSANISRLGVLPPAKLKTLGKKFLIVGWGRDQNGLVTGKLNRLTLNDQTIAAKKDFKSYYNSKTMVGAGRYFADEVLYGGGCTGDSGGPLYQGAAGASRTIIGITSFGARGCIDYKPTIFTRVDFYVPEINKGIELLDSRAVSAPITTGKATPVGVGPTTTTTTTTTTIPRITTTTTIPRTIATTTIPATFTTTSTIASVGTGQLSVSVFPSCTGCRPQVPTSDAAVLNVSASAIAFNWGFSNILGTSLRDGVLINFRGWLKPTAASTYRLCGYSDDGFILDLDGIRVINDWIDRDKAWINCDTAKYATPATVDFSDGRAKQLNAWYYENSGEALVYLWYFTANGWTAVPTSWYISG